MRKVEHRLRLDLLRGGNQGYIRVKRGENGARRLAIALYMHSVPYMADAGTTAVFRAIKPDNTKLFNSATITDNVVTVGLTTQTVAALGTVRCELSIYGTNNELLYSPQFDIIVEDYLYSDTAIESTNEYTDLTEAISKVNNIVSTEAARVAAENQRVANENARVSAEVERASAETARAAAETARATAETERASAETTRASAESSRAFSENIRKQAEKQRVSSETQRDTAETARSTAESDRRSAETARVQEFNAIKADAQDAATAEATRALAEELRMALYNQWDNATASVKGGKNIDVNVVEADGHKNFDFTIPSDSLYCETRTTITNGDLETIAREHARTIIVFDLSPIDFNNENPTNYGLPADIAWNFTLINGPSQNVGTKNYLISYPNATVAAIAFVFACPQTLIDGKNIYMRRLSYWDEIDKDEVSHWKFEGEDWELVGGTADAVTYTPQTLTEEQKSQARTNIGAEKAGTAYTKPASGIPKSDLEQSVQTSLAKADTALQSQTIPDWNQNDETAPDYVKNRPFYTGDPVETVLVEESTVTFAETQGLYMAQFLSTFEATVGETYKVYWDGAAYECTCVNLNDMTVIGNLSIAGAGSDTGEPFLMVVDNGVGISIGTADTSASHTFSISRLATEVVKIDEKYLPKNVATKSEVEVARTTANAAQTTANAAQSTADAAQSTADAAQEVLDGVFSSVATFTFDKQTSGRDTFVFNAFNYYKISDFNPAPENVISFKGTRENGYEISDITIGSNCVEYGFFIVVAAAGRCSLPVTETVTDSFTAPSAGLYACYEEGNTAITAGTGQFTLRASTGSLYITGLLLKSSTANSTKKFKITVDDNGTIYATEVS